MNTALSIAATPSRAAAQHSATQQRALKEEEGDEDLEDAFEQRLMSSIRASGSQTSSAPKPVHRPFSASSKRPASARSAVGANEDDGLVHDGYGDDFGTALASQIEKQLVFNGAAARQAAPAAPVRQAGPSHKAAPVHMGLKVSEQKSNGSPTVSHRGPGTKSTHNKATAAPAAMKALSPVSQAELKRMQDAWDAL